MITNSLLLVISSTHGWVGWLAGWLAGWLGFPSGPHHYRGDPMEDAPLFHQIARYAQCLLLWCPRAALQSAFPLSQLAAAPTVLAPPLPPRLLRVLSHRYSLRQRLQWLSPPYGVARRGKPWRQWLSLILSQSSQSMQELFLGSLVRALSVVAAEIAGHDCRPYAAEVLAVGLLPPGRSCGTPRF